MEPPIHNEAIEQGNWQARKFTNSGVERDIASSIGLRIAQNVL
jgi:hypothetical protein